MEKAFPITGPLVGNQHLHHLNTTDGRYKCIGAKPTQKYFHYHDVIMTMMTSQITSLTDVYSTVYSDADQRKHQSSASLAFVWGIHRDRWIPRTKGQLRGKCFHLMTSSCQAGTFFHHRHEIILRTLFKVYVIWLYVCNKPQATRLGKSDYNIYKWHVIYVGKTVETAWLAADLLSGIQVKIT